MTLVVAGVGLAAALGYGTWRLHEANFVPGPRLALVQGNLPQHIHDDSKKKEVVFKHFAQIAHQATAADPLPDLVIWSETSMPFWWNDVAAEMTGEPLPDDWDGLLRDRKVLQQILQSWAAVPEETRKQVGYGRLATLYGLNARTLYPDGERLYNTALLIDRRGCPTARYDKIYRVPFGEYIPWEETIPLMRKLSPYEGDYGIEPGEQHTVFELEHAAHARFAAFAAAVL
jgi:apolipoprotein N-acyltransferase